jgi:hypothetical protein
VFTQAEITAEDVRREFTSGGHASRSHGTRNMDAYTFDCDQLIPDAIADELWRLWTTRSEPLRHGAIMHVRAFYSTIVLVHVTILHRDRTTPSIYRDVINPRSKHASLMTFDDFAFDKAQQAWRAFEQLFE